MHVSINQELKEITPYIISFIGILNNFLYQKSCPERGREEKVLPQPNPNLSSTSSIQELTPRPLGAGAFLWPWEGYGCLYFFL